MVPRTCDPSTLGGGGRRTRDSRLILAMFKANLGYKIPWLKTRKLSKKDWRSNQTCVEGASAGTGLQLNPCVEEAMGPSPSTGEREKVKFRLGRKLSV